MANFTSYFPVCCYSSELTGFSCSVTPGTVQVSLASELDIFTNVYHISKEYFNFSDYSDIVESFMVEHKLPVMDLLISVTDSESTAQKTVKVVYHKATTHKLTAGELLIAGLLTTYKNRVIYPDCKDYLSFWCEYDYSVGSPIVLSVQLQNASGTIVWSTIDYGKTIKKGLNQLELSCTEIRKYLSPRFTNWDIRYFCFTFNNRTCHFYVSKAHAVKHFVFWNCFNAKETISVPCTTTNVVKTDSSSAICGKKIYHYDIVHNRTYEEQTAALDHERAAVFEQLLTSPHVLIFMEDFLEIAILIESYTFELSNEPNSERSFKFEWQFDQKNGVVVLKDEQQSRIFTDDFYPQFV